MEKFIPKNVCGILCFDKKPELIQVLGDETKRRINFQNGSVTIHDKDGKLIFNKIFEINHPLIINAKIYYFFHKTLKPDLRISRMLARLQRRGQIPIKEIQCEEYYRVKRRCDEDYY